MKFLADECCSVALVASLRNHGHDVLYIKEQKPGSTDDEVLSIAYNEDRILITEDTDFGELVYRLKKPSKGIILIRIDAKERHIKWDRLHKLIERYPNRMKDRFTVIDTQKFRFRPIMKKETIKSEIQYILDQLVQKYLTTDLNKATDNQKPSTNSHQIITNNDDVCSKLPDSPAGT